MSRKAELSAQRFRRLRESKGETVFEYAKRWLEARTGRVASVRDNKGHLNEHILPVIGPLPIRGVEQKDVEDFVAALDRKVRDGAIGAKTAKNVWGTCSKMFDDAAHSKPAEGLRCLDKDPTLGVRGPDDNEADKLLRFLYPSEVSSFMACADVPITWVVNALVAAYLCLRDGEQRALKWSAVDLEHGVVTIVETYDRRAEKDREGTKSGAARVVPIRPELIFSIATVLCFSSKRSSPLAFRGSVHVPSSPPQSARIDRRHGTPVARRVDIERTRLHPARPGRNLDVPCRRPYVHLDGAASPSPSIADAPRGPAPACAAAHPLSRGGRGARGQDPPHPADLPVRPAPFRIGP